MKAIIVLIIYFTISFYSFAEIKNGYKKDLSKAEQTLQNLKIIMDDIGDNEDLFTTVKTRYIMVKGEFKLLKKFFSITDEMIYNLQITHPVLFDEIDGIQDQLGNETDVYIRVQPEEHMKKLYWGTTNLQHVEGDPHTYKSRYGPGTVSIHIRHCERNRRMRLLIHELGHVKYQVPNLAVYTRYFEEKYKYSRSNDALGHSRDDPSNQSVIAELKRFDILYRERKHLLKNSSKTSVLLAETRPGMNDSY